MSTAEQQEQLELPNAEWAYCVSHKEMFDTHNVVAGVTYIIAATLVFVITVMYLKAKVTGNAFSSGSALCKCGHLHCNLYWLGLALFLSSFVCLLSSAIMNLTMCDTQHASLNRVSYAIFYQSYIINYMVLIAMLFARLVAIFEGTAMQVSTRFVTLFWCAFALLVVSGLLGAWLISIDASAALKFACIIVGGLVGMGLMVQLGYSFVHKLLLVLRSDTSASQNSHLKAVITKSSMLSLISLAMTMIGAASLNMYTYFPNVRLYFLFLFISSVDVVSNAVCIWLTYQHFAAYYNSLCTACDNRWSRCLLKSAPSDPESSKVATNISIASSSSPSPSSVSAV